MTRIIYKFIIISVFLLLTKAVYSADEQSNCLCDNTSGWRYCQQFGRLLQEVNNCLLEKKSLMQEINWWIIQSNYDKERLIELQQLQINELKKRLAQKTLPLNQAQQLPKSNNVLSVGNDKLIVISLSAGLKDTEKMIKDSFFNVFSELKKSKSETPFNLFTLQTGRELYSLLSYRELQSLPIEGEDSLLSKIEITLNFGATDLQALADLSLVDNNILQEQPSIGSILYLTDNTGISENIQKIPSKQRGVPLVWHKDGIALTVLTTKECQVWEYMEAKCVVWQNKTDLIRELNTFLNQ